jgi:hypothetical protein
MNWNPVKRRAPSPHPSPPAGPVGERVSEGRVRGKPWFSGSMCEGLLGRILTPALSHRMAYVYIEGFTSVAAAILATVEGGILPPGPQMRNGSAFANHAIPPGRMPD